MAPSQARGGLLTRQSSTSSDESAPSDVAFALLAPVLLGDCLQLTLYGLLISAFSSWINSSWSRTPRLPRITITFVLVLVTLVTSFNVVDILHFGTLQVRTDDALLTGTMTEALEPLLVGVIGALVESLLVYSVAKIIPSTTLKVVFIATSILTITLGLLGSIGAAVWSVAYFRSAFLESTFPITFNKCVAIWLWSAAISDCFITGAFVVLFRKRIAGYNESTDSVLKKICNLSIKSAAFTTVFAVPGALLSVIFNGNSLITTDIAYAFWIPLPGLYGLSLFTTLTAPGRLSSQLRGVASRPPETILPRDQSSRSGQRITSVESQDAERRRRVMEGVNVRIELWIAEEHNDDPEEEQEQEKNRQTELLRSSSWPDVTTSPAPTYLCPT